MRYGRHQLKTWFDSICFTPTPIAAGVCRLVLSIHFLMILWDFFPRQDFAKQPSNLYNPVGVMCLYGTQSMPLSFVRVMYWVANISTGFLLLGLYSRLALAVSTLAMLHCCSAYYSFVPAPAHVFIPGQLAALGLWFGVRSPLSLDYLLARARQGSATERYWFTPRLGVMLAMFSVSWPLADAALFKLYLGNREWFAWVDSDNLRNTLIFQWWKFQEPLPAYLEWIAREPVLWKGMAFANIVCQLSPILAIFLVRRPWLRLLLALVVLAEILGLIFVMKMWDGYGKMWLSFALFFVDWDSWLQKRSSSPTLLVTYPRWRVFAAGVFIGVVLWHSLTAQFHRKRYPFQPFTMFSTIQAHKPYSVSQPYPYFVNDWQIQSTPALAPEQYARIFLGYHSLGIDPEQACRKIELRCQEYGLQVHSIVGIQSYHVVPAPPQTQIERHPRATLIKWERTATGEKHERLAIDSLRVMQTSNTETVYQFKLHSVGEFPQRMRFAYIRGLDPTPYPIEVTKEGAEYKMSVPNLQENVILVLLAEGRNGESTTWFGSILRIAP